jgi:hypothetical protein
VIIGSENKGIQLVADTVWHEMYHHKIYQQFGRPDVTVDADRDNIPDAQEMSGFMGMMTATNSADTYRFCVTVPGYLTANNGDEEVRCWFNETKGTPPVYPEKDWANPGCQHFNQYGPRVNP